MSDKTVEIFGALEPMLEAETGGPVHLVRINGQRWSYVAGRVPENEPFLAPQRVILDESWALMFFPENGVDIDRGQVRELFRKHRVTQGGPGS